MKLYTTIETCPIYNFRKFEQTGDHKFLAVDDTLELTEDLKTEIEINYQKMLFDLPEGSLNLEILIKEMDIQFALLDFEINNDYNAKNRANKLAKQIEIMRNRKTKHISLDEEVVNIELCLGIQINVNTCSVSKYMAYYRKAIKMSEKRK